MYIGIGTIVVIVIIVLVILMLRRLCPQALIPICRMNLTRRYQEAAGGKPMGAET